MGISDLKKMSLVETLQVNQDLCYLYPEVTKASILAHFGIAAPVSAAPVSATPFSQPRYKQPIKSESAVPPELNRLFHNCAV
uniref:Uncharacterized protein n=1 Tax=Plectus sambesii TaxID=2011161 RepID=A0A914W4V3_9BILA